MTIATRPGKYTSIFIYFAEIPIFCDVSNIWGNVLRNQNCVIILYGAFFFLILLLQFFFLLLNMSKYANNFWIISIDAEHVQSYEDLISNKLSLKYLESFVQFMDFNVFLVVAISSISNEWMLSSVSAIRQRISYSIWIKSRLW